MLTVSAKSMGRRKPLFADFSVPPPAAVEAGSPVTLRELIAHVVRSEVAGFHGRQAERRLLKALTATQIEEGLAKGKVEMGGSELNQHVDVEQAIQTATEAFQDGLFLAVVDEDNVTDLDAPLTLAADCRLTFIRLTMLAGG